MRPRKRASTQMPKMRSLMSPKEKKRSLNVKKKSIPSPIMEVLEDPPTPKK